MANINYERLSTSMKEYEVQDNLKPNTWIVIRIDGRGFTKFSQTHQFQKPNDMMALELMNASAVAVVEDLPNIVFAYGYSDKFSFILRKTSTLFHRRASKLVSVICSLFASSYVMNWEKFFPCRELQCAPSFDGRAFCFPHGIFSYLYWQQLTCHDINLYFTCYWSIVESGKSTAEARNTLKGTTWEEKIKLLHEAFNINYYDHDQLPHIFRFGSSIYRKNERVVELEGSQVINSLRSNTVVLHDVNMHDTSLFRTNPHILNGK